VLLLVELAVKELLQRFRPGVVPAH
jgi:hypothetical protein